MGHFPVRYVTNYQRVDFQAIYAWLQEASVHGGLLTSAASLGLVEHFSSNQFTQVGFKRSSQVVFFPRDTKTARDHPEGVDGGSEDWNIGDFNSIEFHRKAKTNESSLFQDGHWTTYRCESNPWYPSKHENSWDSWMFSSSNMGFWMFLIGFDPSESKEHRYFTRFTNSYS